MTPSVFWAVSATIAHMPWQPAAAKAFRSAWIPAPPPESEPAIVRQRGTKALPSPVRAGSGSTGVFSAPMRGTPVRAKASTAPMARRAPRLGRAARRARSSRTSARSPPERAAPPRFPDELDPRVPDALAAAGIDRLYAHQADAWDAARAASTSSSRPGRRAARRSPSTSPSSTRSRATRSPRALPLPDEGARAGPGARARRRSGCRASAGDLRRRHRARAALADPQAGRT